MLNRIIAASLRYRVLVVSAAVLLLLYGGGVVSRMPVDVLPDLNRPVVTIMTEAHGLAPEEVEPLVTFPIETLMNGATGVQRVRSASSAGLSIVWVEFDWGQDIFRARQIVNEKLQLAQARLPEGTLAGMGPIASIMGEMMLVSLSSEGNQTPPHEVRALADWVVRPRLLAVPGVAQVVPIGGGAKQFQVLTNPARLQQHGVTLDQLTEAVRQSNLNTSGGFLQTPQREMVIRITGRARSLEDIARTVVTQRDGVPVTVGHVADVRFGQAQARGDASVDGQPAVILSVQKQPDTNTLALTRELDRALSDLQPSLPPDVTVNRQLFRQSDFISAAIDNVQMALRDGAILVSLILLLFLFNLRATFITLTAIPLSFVVAMLVLDRFGITVNTMTLGGLAIAIGLVVDDSIVDVENIVRRLRENRMKAAPEPAMNVIYKACAEVRNSIVFATVIIVLVFLPLLTLEGMEGRVFQPLGVAFIVALSASLMVALTVTPALSAILMARRRRSLGPEGDTWLVRHLKRLDAPLVRWSIRHPAIVLSSMLALMVGAGALVPSLGREFLPPFNEGSLSVSALLPPGTGMAESNRMGAVVERELLSVPEVTHTGRRTGRAEMDEHAKGVYFSEIDVGLRVSERPRSEVLAEVRRKMQGIPGVMVSIGQPISHRLDHMATGVPAALAVKVYGPDLDTLRRLARDIRDTMAEVPGVVDLMVEPQIDTPQVQVAIDRDAAARHGLSPGRLAETLETALGGHAVSQVLQQQRAFDVVVWFDEPARSNLDAIRGTLISTPSGARVPLGQLATVRKTRGPNTINRENVSRRIVVQANVQGRDLNSVVTDLQARMRTVQADWSPGYFVEYGGQFEAQQAAMRRLLLLGAYTVVVIFLVLMAALGSWLLALQVMVNLPQAMVGGILAVYLTGGVLSVASMVGFITLFGIVTRNGIMMLSHYVHLMREEGEPFGEKMIVRGTLERLSPVLMTALTAALALLPLAFALGQPGKELLQPIAVVILGGLLSSTLLDQVVTPSLFHLVGPKEWAALPRDAAADGLQTPPGDGASASVPSTAATARPATEIG
ncbi:MAG TPA: efflux RND transporter permease subunit [Chthonomonadales bacterium]|nr:efflux RND transporter permease subunit [Chthonomonadales bacterium]